MKKYISEMIGTMILVAIGCGAAISLAKIGIAGVSLAFGISIIAVAYTFGSISGAHLNPAVTVGMLVSKRINIKDAGMYILFQVIGAFIGSLILISIFGKESGLGINVIQDGYTLLQGIMFEMVFTFIFVLIILFVTSKKGNEQFAGLVIGLTLTGIHLVGISVTGTSVNPARSIAPALLTMDSSALSQLWIFILFPLIGAVFASLVFNLLIKED